MSRTFVCFACRTTKRGRWARCPNCDQGMILIGERLCVPQRRSDYGWQLLERRVVRSYILKRLFGRFARWQGQTTTT